MSKRDELLRLLSKDPLGLLKVQDKEKHVSPERNALIASFEEIHQFVEDHGREPESNLNNAVEFQLYARLKALRKDPNKVKALQEYDFLGLFTRKDVKELSIEDVIAEDPFGLLDDDVDVDVFNIKHIKRFTRVNPEYLARRRICKDFSEYREMFAALHDELAFKHRRLVRYRPEELKVGRFYVLSGILVYLKSVSADKRMERFESGDRERLDGRTLVIFDNETQSDMLLRSLNKALQVDGYSISDAVPPADASTQVTVEDICNGYIYVLKSKSKRVEHIKNLYKIGHTTDLVSNRIRKAKQEPAYLYDDVQVVATYRCFNVKSYNIEQAIHDFFGSACLRLELQDGTGKVHKPQEWFIVELPNIEDAINLILTNRINEYVYDRDACQIVKK